MLEEEKKKKKNFVQHQSDQDRTGNLGVHRYIRCHVKSHHFRLELAWQLQGLLKLPRLSHSGTHAGPVGGYGFAMIYARRSSGIGRTFAAAARLVTHVGLELVRTGEAVSSNRQLCIDQPHNYYVKETDRELTTCESYACMGWAVLGESCWKG